ncbi:unnamed protein product [Meloidogyne enterolobii]|uniref:Uncharacterized protein n=1 Tax=Meloidogyne enterolobii TaxID=390850 RepID=A0ACB0ZRF0_MELEN
MSFSLLFSKLQIVCIKGAQKKTPFFLLLIHSRLRESFHTHTKNIGQPLLRLALAFLFFFLIHLPRQHLKHCLLCLPIDFLGLFLVTTRINLNIPPSFPSFLTLAFKHIFASFCF